MTLSLSHYYIWPMEGLAMGSLREILEPLSGPVETDQRIDLVGWNSGRAKKILCHPSLPKVDDPAVTSLTFDDIRGLSVTEAIHKVEAIIIVPVSTVGSVGYTADMLMISERDVRRMQEMAVELGLIVRDEYHQLLPLLHLETWH